MQQLRERRQLRRGNLITHLQIDLTLESLSYLLHRALEHAPRAGDEVAVLTLLSHDVEHDHGDLLLISHSLLLYLREVCLIDVQGVHID